MEDFTDPRPEPGLWVHDQHDGAPAMRRTTEVVTLRCDPTAARQARQFAARVCASAGLASELCDTAVLLTSETVTNAILHGRSPARLTVTAGPAGVRVEVGDDNSRHPVLRVSNDLTALDGRGILLLTACATAWGVTPDRYGKVVWFEVRAA